ncbi:MAG: hypothetical protein ABIJ09_25110 [Pseudomonadota bacterium]
MSDKGSKKKKKAQPKQPEPVARKSTGASLPFELEFERGNYAGARHLALGAVAGADGARARDILDRIRVDKIPLLVFAGCLALIALIAGLGLG